MKSILEVRVKCRTCGAISLVGECEGDVDGDGSLGCPVPDCGGIARELPGELDDVVHEIPE